MKEKGYIRQNHSFGTNLANLKIHNKTQHRFVKRIILWLEKSFPQLKMKSYSGDYFVKQIYFFGFIAS